MPKSFTFLANLADLLIFLAKVIIQWWYKINCFKIVNSVRRIVDRIIYRCYAIWAVKAMSCFAQSGGNLQGANRCLVVFLCRGNSRIKTPLHELSLLLILHFICRLKTAKVSEFTIKLSLTYGWQSVKCMWGYRILFIVSFCRYIQKLKIEYSLQDFDKTTYFQRYQYAERSYLTDNSFKYFQS